MNEEKELRELLENIPDWYEDLADLVLKIAKKNNVYADFIEFIKEHPQAISDDICLFIDINYSQNTAWLNNKIPPYSWEE